MFGIAGLGNLVSDITRRRSIAQRIEAAATKAGFEVQHSEDDSVHTPLETPIIFKNAKKLKHLLLQHGIDTQATWMRSYTQLPLFKHLAKNEAFVASKLARQTLYLPTYPAMTDKEVDHLVEVIAAIGKTLFHP
jgi:dTDP-4-amino-4,6-dideoxygalactose transaminase